MLFCNILIRFDAQTMLVSHDVLLANMLSKLIISYVMVANNTYWVAI